MQQHGSIVANSLPALLHPLIRSWGGVKMSKFNFSEHVQVAYQFKWNHKRINMVANSLTAIPPPRGWGQKVKIQLLKIGMLHINGITNAAEIWHAPPPPIDPGGGVKHSIFFQIMAM